ncbi:MAG: hypothetical protein HEP71_15280 [Roseivirga sp.]|nr:hypothetical protein [Roseivirga sp.]
MGKVQTGIWIDSREALIFAMRKDSEHFERIVSEVEEYHVHSEGKSASPFVVRDAIKEKQILNRRTLQFQKFFTQVLEAIALSDEVLVCGPGETKSGLEKAILSDKQRSYRLMGCHTLDSLTENQIRAWIRERFGLRR